MRTTRTKIILFGAGGLLVAGAAWPAIAVAADNPRAVPAAGTVQAHPPGPHGGGPRAGESVAELAKELGVTEEKLEAALESIRADRKPAEGGARPSAPPGGQRGERGQDLAAALADKLGIAEDKVAAALERVRAQEQDARRTERTARLTERLDKAVADGKLTRAEADAVGKAADAGVLWGEGR